MTDEQKAALEWFEGLANGVIMPRNIKHFDTIRQMLAEPGLPKEPTIEILGVMRDAANQSRWANATAEAPVYRALYAYLTKPKTKTVWEINGCGRSAAPYECDCRADAPHEIASCIERLHREGFTCITIITREVPA